MFDGLMAEVYDSIYASKDYAGEATRIARDLEPAEAFGDELLEFGCGTGNFLREWPRFGWAAWGVDISPSMVAIAKAKGLMAKCDWPIARVSHYAAVVAPFAVLSYVQHGDLHRTLSHLRQSMVRGGILAFDVFNLACAAANLRRVSHYQHLHNGQKLDRRIEKKFRAKDSLVLADITVTLGDRTYSEQHWLACYDPPHLRHLLCEAGFLIRGFSDYEHPNDPISTDTCYLYCVAEAL
jgi:SAM-dependent methyltransferase